MQKLLTSCILGAMLVVASPSAHAASVANLEPGETLLELGVSLDSKVKGQINQSPLEAAGESGFKSAITYAVNDKIEVQYRKNMFQSKETTAHTNISGYALSLTTKAHADLTDYNLLYKLNDHHKAIVGYETNKISYEDYVHTDKRSSWHIGLNNTYPLSEKATLFTNNIYGQKVRSNEIGVQINFSDRDMVSVSYIDRRTNDMKVTGKYASMPFDLGKTDYKMTGIAIMYGMKFK